MSEAVDASADSITDPEILRARAAHVRALARSVAHDPAAEMLHGFAAELESRAAALEGHAGTSCTATGGASGSPPQ
jgi:hypothetical protein